MEYRRLMNFMRYMVNRQKNKKRGRIRMYFVNNKIKDLYRVKFHDCRKKIIRLDMNENPQGLPLDFVEEIKEKITPEFLATYPEKDELVELIAEHNKLTSEHVTVTAGSDEAMRLVFQCFGEEGKTVLTVTPTFEMYDIYSKMFGMKHKQIAYNENLQISINEIIENIDDNVGLIVLLNPNSPIGTIYTDDEFDKILEKAKQSDAMVIVDEAYHYYYENTVVPKIKDNNNLIVLRTFSKLCSIAGLRVGYAMSSKENVKCIENAESTFNVNSVGLLFATEVLKRPDIMRQIQQEEKEGHEWLEKQVTNAGYKFFSAYGNYLLIYPRKDSKIVVQELKKRNIWIRDYGSGRLKGWIRVSTGSKTLMESFWRNFLEVDEL